MTFANSSGVLVTTSNPLSSRVLRVRPSLARGCQSVVSAFTERIEGRGELARDRIERSTATEKEFTRTKVMQRDGHEQTPLAAPNPRPLLSCAP
jgi:hypothetical protein